MITLCFSGPSTQNTLLRYFKNGKLFIHCHQDVVVKLAYCKIGAMFLSVVCKTPFPIATTSKCWRNLWANCIGWMTALNFTCFGRWIRAISLKGEIKNQKEISFSKTKRKNYIFLRKHSFNVYVLKKLVRIVLRMHMNSIFSDMQNDTSLFS